MSMLGGLTSVAVAEPAANFERVQLFNAAQPIKFQAEESKLSRRFKRIFGPVQFSFADLRHPTSLLRAAKNRLRWNAPEVSGSVSEGMLVQSLSQPAIDSALGARTFDVSLSHAPGYQFRSQWPRTAGSRILLAGYFDPKTTPVQTSLPYRTSATQLQVRMHNEMSLLWEVARSSSAIAGDELGLGLGLRYNF